MERLSNLKIGTRFAAGFGFLLLLMAILTIASILEVTGINRKLTQINDVNSVKHRYAINLRGSVHDTAIAVRDVVLLDNGQDRQQAVDHIRELAATYAENERDLTAMLSDEAGSTDVERRIMQKIQEIQTETAPVVDRIIAVREDDDFERARALLLSLARSRYVAWLDAINEFIDHQEALSQSTGAKVQRSAGNFGLIAGGALLVALVLAALASTLTVRSITHPMNRLQDLLNRMAKGEDAGADAVSSRKDELGDLARAVADVRNAVEQTAKRAAAERAAHQEEQLRQAEVASAEREEAARRLGAEARAREEAAAEANRKLEDIAREQEATAAQINSVVASLAKGLQELSAGNLEYRIEDAFDGSLDELRHDFNQASDRLNKAMQQIGAIAESVNGRAAEISDASNDLSRRTEQQAASVADTVEAIRQIAQIVTDTSQSAEEARHSVERTRQNAEDSGAVVSKAIDAMGQIEDSSREIMKIIGIIDDIAFQTNLLALNAGVEAARAGDAGRGFSIVAQEVRALAQRSAVAAKGINELIEKSANLIRSGVSLVGETGSSLTAIVTEVQAVDEQMHSITQSSREQASSLQGIQKAMNSMDSTTQRNAAMVEETTAVTQVLASDANELTAQIAQFQATKIAGNAQILSAPSNSRMAPAKVKPVRHDPPAPKKAVGWEEF